MVEKWYNRFLWVEPKEIAPTKADFALLYVTLITTLFVPYIPVNASFFLSLEEVFVGMIAVRLLIKRFFWLDKFVVILMLFAGFIFLSILINSHRTELREYFELYKIFKIGILYLFSIFLFLGSKKISGIVKFVNVIFVLLVAFNFLHYFNVWHFNENVTILFDSDQRDTLNFGLNSLGLPAAKRMIGTMGNPNDNAILFLLFFAFYQSRLTVLNSKNKSFFVYKLMFLLATLMVLLCQSRTGILIGVVVYIVGLFQRKLTKDVLYELLIIGLAVVLMFIISSNSLQYLANTKLRLQDNSAVMGRWEVAKKLFGMWTEKPIFGYGPNKTYMYGNKIYPENEYLFHIWRYGIMGLILYCLLLWYILLKFLREKVKMPLYVCVIIVFSFAALSNLPVMNPKFSFIFALVAGFSTCQYYIQKRQKNEYVETD